MYFGYMPALNLSLSSINTCLYKIVHQILYINFAKYFLNNQEALHKTAPIYS